MKIDIEFDNPSLKFITDFPDIALSALQRGFRLAIIDAEGQAKRAMGKGQAPKVRTGHLRRSIYSKVSGFKAVIGSPVKYSAILHFGGTINHPGSVARNKKALYFVYKGKQVFCKSTKPHKIEIPPHPYVLLSVKHRAKRRFEKIMDNHFTKEMEKTIAT